MATPQQQDQQSSSALSLTPQQIAQLVAANQQAQGGVAPVDTPLVPLWMTRPTPKRMPLSKPDEEGHRHGTLSYSPLVDASTSAVTKDYAETHWMDMSPEDRAAFAEKAQKAGMWDPTDGSGALVRVWSQAVDMAATYNGARQGDPSKWLSPFETLDKLYAQNIAGMNGAVNGFTGWKTQRYKQITKFSANQLADTAKSILQQELGRDPTQAELNAYTIAVNRAAAENPQVVTEKTRDTKFDATGKPIDSETQRTVQGDTFNPNETIQNQVQGSQEHKDYQAATTYFQAAMQALNAIA